ncbi:hypothetical protein IFM89_030549, partial [Coptis chinensis]
SVCGADDEALDDMEPMEEEVQNLEEEIQGSDSSVVRVSANIFEAEEMAKLAGPKVENVFVCNLKPKMSWPTVEACRDFFINLAIRKKFSYRHLKNDKERLILECKDFNCQWKVSASVTKRDNHTFILRKFLDQHTCEADDENKYAQATSPWVAKTLVDKMRDHPDYKPRDIQKEIFSKFPGELWESLAWEAAMTYKLPELTRILGTINKTDSAALDWLDNEPRECWARAHFDWTSKCDELTNNFSESFNSWILKIRDKPLVQFIDMYNLLLLKSIYDRRMLSMKSFEHGVVPNVLYMIKKREERYNNYEIRGVKLRLSI